MTILRRAELSNTRFLNPVPTEVGGFKVALGVAREYFLSRKNSQRTPIQPPGPFATDPSLYALLQNTAPFTAASAAQPGNPSASSDSLLRVTWFGHSSSLLEIDGLRVLIDPVWDPRASPLSSMGPKRFFPPTIRLDRLPRLDVILISHDHYDHLGRETVQALAKLECAEGARWVTSIGVGAILRDFGVKSEQITELDWTDQVRLRSGQTGAELKLTALPARHFSGRMPWNRFETLWSSFALQGEHHRVYYGADSGFWEGFAEIAQQYGPFHLTMLEIGASNVLWKDIHLGPDGAAKAFAAMGGSGLLMPIHWGLFDLALHAWQQPIERITQLADAIGIRLFSPEPGKPTEVLEGLEVRSNWWCPPTPPNARSPESDRKNTANRLTRS